MPRTYINKKRYLEVGQAFHWATKEHYQGIFTGRFDGRHSRTEKVLPRLVAEKKLITLPYDRKLVYSVPRRCRGKRSKLAYRIEHGLACTECLVRTWISDTTGVIYPEHRYRKFKSVPEWGIKYKDNALLFEFASLDNFNRTKLMKDKIERYIQYGQRIFGEMNCKSGLVLFVCDTGKDEIHKFLKTVQLDGNFFFTNYKSFLNTNQPHLNCRHLQTDQIPSRNPIEVSTFLLQIRFKRWDIDSALSEDT